MLQAEAAYEKEVGSMEISGWFVMALGMITVFLGLIALLYITKLTSALCRALTKQKTVS